MTAPTGHYAEELQDLLDERLAPSARAAVERHLAECERCRETLARLARSRNAVRGLPPVAPPAGLALRVARALDAADAAQRRRPRRRRLAAAGGALAVTAFLVVLMRSMATPADPVAAAARDFARYRDGALTLEVVTPEPAAVERFFAARGVGFPARVFDLTMMGYRLTGGRIHRLGGRPSALYAYAGRDGERVVCQMFEGSPTRLPDPVETRVHGGITFRIHRVGGTTLVVWQEGAVLCVLASDGSAETLLQLAYAKAVKVASLPA